MKIPKAQWLLDVEKGEVDLYSIAGLFLDPTLGKTPLAVAFSGYFKFDRKNYRIGAGQICDYYGISRIEDGFMERDLLEFEKRYEGRNCTISYRFRKKGKIWTGHFVSPRVNGEHPIEAIVTLVDADAFHVVDGRMRNV